MVVTMNPFMMALRGFLTKESARTEFAPQFFACEQTKRINGRRITFDAPGNCTEASRSRPRLPGGSDIALAYEERGLLPSQLPSFSISRTVVMTPLRRSTEARRQWESP
jgi:hypothetical protein